MTNERKELLLKMYDQMFSDINRHILVVWQSVAVVIGAFAVFALAEKQIIPIDVATSLVLLLCGWLIAHLYDAGYWYNRNLVIIANIERQFLSKEDLHDIHYYFGKHRPNNGMITHLQIQYALAVGVGMLLLVFHFITRIWPGFFVDGAHIDPLRALPYLTLVGLIFYLRKVAKHRDQSYAEFIKNSPGIDIETAGLEYGVGHGFPSGGG